MTTLVMRLVICAFALALAAPAVFADDAVATVTPAELQKKLEADRAPLLVDVREPDEFAAGHIRQALLAPLGNVAAELRDVPKNREIVLVCRSGRRSEKALRLLAEQGYTKLWNLEGGMIAWAKAGYPVVK